MINFQISYAILNDSEEMYNEALISNADMVIAFWDGSSKGTKNSIDHAKNMSKQLYVLTM